MRVLYFVASIVFMLITNVLVLSARSEEACPKPDFTNDEVNRKVFVLPGIWDLKSKDRFLPIGTAFLVHDQGFLMTAGHVVENPDSLVILAKDRNGEDPVPLKFIKIPFQISENPFVVDDWALIKLTDPNALSGIKGLQLTSEAEFAAHSVDLPAMFSGTPGGTEF